MLVAHRRRYSGPKPRAKEVGFVDWPPRTTGGRFEIMTAEEVMNDPRPRQEEAEERAMLAALTEGGPWMARRTTGTRCPGCGKLYADRPAIQYVKDMAFENRVWDGRVYELGPNERAYKDAFHWLVWWQHDKGCGLPVSYAVTEAQVIMWTDACGPWHRRKECGKMMMAKLPRDFTCERCGSHNGRWARGLESGRWVCANCYSELPFDSLNPDPTKRNLVVDDLRTDIPTRRKVVVRW